MLKFIFLSYRVNSQIWLNLIVYDWIRLSMKGTPGCYQSFLFCLPLGEWKGASDASKGVSFLRNLLFK
jgi:hypothetical protein